MEPSHLVVAGPLLGLKVRVGIAHGTALNGWFVSLWWRNRDKNKSLFRGQPSRAGKKSYVPGLQGRLPLFSQAFPSNMNEDHINPKSGQKMKKENRESQVYFA